MICPNLNIKKDVLEKDAKGNYRKVDMSNKRKSKAADDAAEVKKFLEVTQFASVFNSMNCVAPRQRHYYCEYCKADVSNIDADEKFELVASFITRTVKEVVIAKHKKCGHILTERFWEG
jgi:hypothetical protein